MSEEEIIKKMAETNEPQYNLIKASEELTELQELLLKKVLKDGHKKCPSNQSIIDEIGDAQIRLDVLKKIFGEKEVKERISFKLNKFLGYLKEGLYIGRI